MPSLSAPRRPAASRRMAFLTSLPLGEIAVMLVGFALLAAVG